MKLVVLTYGSAINASASGAVRHSFQNQGIKRAVMRSVPKPIVANPSLEALALLARAFLSTQIVAIPRIIERQHNPIYNERNS
jgi:uncharacterized membrane protein